MMFRLSTISDNRTPLMGIAALMIILCHAVQYGVVMNDFLSSLLIWGNSGVVIFLFLSGFGCFYSLSENDNLLKWYKRRHTRIYTALTFIGTISLESYLTNVEIKNRMSILLSNMDSGSRVLFGHYAEYPFVIAAGLALSWAIH